MSKTRRTLGQQSKRLVAWTPEALARQWARALARAARPVNGTIEKGTIGGGRIEGGTIEKAL